MVHSVTHGGGINASNPTPNPTKSVNAVVNSFELLISQIQTQGPSYLAELSPSQVLGQVDFLNDIGSKIGGAFGESVQSMANILSSLVAPYNQLSDSDFSAWMKGQTSFPDYKMTLTCQISQDYQATRQRLSPMRKGGPLHGELPAKEQLIIVSLSLT